MNIESILHHAGVRRTRYALAVAYGQQRLSGADLRGKAGSYGGSYAKTRRAVVNALLDSDIGVVVKRDKKTGLLSLDYGDGSNPFALPDGARPGLRCALGCEVWVY